MARLKRKIKGKTSKRKVEEKSSWNILSRIKFAESYTSLILGAIVVLIAGILFVSFARGNKNAQTSSTRDVSKIEEQNSNTSSTYTVNLDDDLWSISEKVYKDGYKWVEIAKANKLKNPGLIYAGNKLVIPTITPNVVQKEIAQNEELNPQAQNSVIQNNSITGNSYTVVRGDNLWDIAVRAYGDGFRWQEIAKANNLANPSLIFSGNVFIIPR